MALTHSDAAKQAATDAVVDLFDGGAGNPEGHLIIRDSTTVLATLLLSDPSFGAAATSGIATANAIADDTSAAASGDADNFQIVDKASVLILSGSITLVAGGGDIEMDNINITIGQTVSMTSLTYQGETP